MESRTNQRRILMVEDTASVAALYKSYLNPLGVSVTIVGTGTEALDFVKDVTPRPHLTRLAVT